jgi:hypothetical protein
MCGHYKLTATHNHTAQPTTFGRSACTLPCTPAPPSPSRARGPAPPPAPHSPPCALPPPPAPRASASLAALAAAAACTAARPAHVSRAHSRSESKYGQLWRLRVCGAAGAAAGHLPVCDERLYTPLVLCGGRGAHRSSAHRRACGSLKYARNTSPSVGISKAFSGSGAPEAFGAPPPPRNIASARCWKAWMVCSSASPVGGTD